MTEQIVGHFPYEGKIVRILGVEVVPDCESGAEPGDGPCYWDNAPGELSCLRHIGERVAQERRKVVLVRCGSMVSWWENKPGFGAISTGETVYCGACPGCGEPACDDPTPWNAIPLGPGSEAAALARWPRSFGNGAKPAWCGKVHNGCAHGMGPEHCGECHVSCRPSASQNEEDFAKLTKAVAGMTDEALAAASGKKAKPCDHTTADSCPNCSPDPAPSALEAACPGCGHEPHKTMCHTCQFERKPDCQTFAIEGGAR